MKTKQCLAFKIIEQNFQRQIFHHNYRSRSINDPFARFCIREMRPLTEEEAKLVFEKLFKFVGSNLKTITERGGETHCFRLHNNKVFYIRDSVARHAVNIPRKDLIGLGSCIGKLTHSKKFHLTVGALDLLAENAVYKIWVKPSAEQQFLYGKHILKSGLGRITENTPVNAGMVVFNMADIPLGFAISARTTAQCRDLDPTATVALNQVDTGDYIRSEQDIL